MIRKRPERDARSGARGEEVWLSIDPVFKSLTNDCELRRAYVRRLSKPAPAVDSSSPQWPDKYDGAGLDSDFVIPRPVAAPIDL